MAHKIFTIGVYGFTEQDFFRTLVEHNVDLFCDIRARRGMRGATYAFANARRLQESLFQHGIPYIHLKALAPSALVRESQKKDDFAFGTLKRNRELLGEEFQNAYKIQCLQHLDAAKLIYHQLDNPKNPLFFCVERLPDACHRSLLAAELCRQLGRDVEHIMP